MKRELSELLQKSFESSELVGRIGSDVAKMLREAICDPNRLSDDDPYVGKVISQYEVVKKLAEGGMGVVYKARDTKLGRLVALKFLPTGVYRNDEARKRFVREARAASAVEHPNICSIYDIGETDDGKLFIAMAYVPGETLKSKLERGRLDLEEALEYARQLTRALQRAHQRGIVHRDVKPGNVIIDEEGSVRLLDFGLAKVASDSGLTKAGALAGTVSYMSPEQVRSGSIDARTDIWSLGVLAYEMIAGVRPFEGMYDQAILYSILNVEPTHLSSYCDDERVAAAIMTALEKDPENRHSDMQAFRQALERQKAYRSNHAGKSILVLPFEDVSPNRDNQYFSDGMSEELISALSQVGSLRVICRTSAWQAKGKDIATLRRELDVDYVLEGSVRKAGDRIRVTPRLIDTTTESTMWSVRHEGVLNDIFDIQDGVAQATVQALKLRLSGDETIRLAHRPIENARAYEAYLRAREEILRYTPASLERALQHLKNGIKLAGENAVLYAGIGYVHWTYANLGIDREENLAEARLYAERAFNLAPDLALGFRVVGLIAALEGNQVEALRHLKRAYQLDTNDLETLQWLRIMYGYVGKLDEAWPLAEKEMSIDPLNPVSQAAKGWLHFMQGDFELVIEPYRRMFESDPDNPAYIYFYAQALGYTDRRREAYELIDILLRDMPEHPYAWMCRCFKYALQGDRDEFEASMTPKLKAMAREDLSHAWFLADCCSLIGDEAGAVRWLEIAVDLGFVNYPFLSSADPFLRRLEGNNEFDRLMERVRNEWKNF